MAIVPWTTTSPKNLKLSVVEIVPRRVGDGKGQGIVWRELSKWDLLGEELSRNKKTEEDERNREELCSSGIYCK